MGTTSDVDTPVIMQVGPRQYNPKNYFWKFIWLGNNKEIGKKKVYKRCHLFEILIFSIQNFILKKKIYFKILYKKSQNLAWPNSEPNNKKKESGRNRN